MEERWFLISKEHYTVGKHYYNKDINLSDPWEPFSGGFILVPYSELLCQVWRDGNCYEVEIPEGCTIYHREIDGLNYAKTGSVLIVSDSEIVFFDILQNANRKIKNRAILEFVKNDEEVLWKEILEQTKDEKLLYLGLLKDIKKDNEYAIKSLVKKGKELNIHLIETSKNALQRKASCKEDEIKKALAPALEDIQIEGYVPVSVLIDYSKDMKTTRKYIIFNYEDKTVIYSAILGVEKEIRKEILGNCFNARSLRIGMEELKPVEVGALKDIRFVDCPELSGYSVVGVY